MENVMSISIRNTLISVAVLVSAILALLAINGIPATVQSVGGAAVALVWSIRQRQPLTEYYVGCAAFGLTGEMIGAACDPEIRSLWQQQGLPQ
jgi:4-hydroxybenzoate polyprenyltransferase